MAAHRVRSLLDEPAGITAWWDAGMRIEQATLAAELARREITPRMPGVVVRRRTILERVQDGAAVEDVVRLLQPHRAPAAVAEAGTSTTDAMWSGNTRL